MRMLARWSPMLFGSLALTACSGEPDRRRDDDPNPIEKPPPLVIDLVVDANRDGVAKADDPGDQEFETTWDATHGAIFLANLDDDDEDGFRDATDAAFDESEPVDVFVNGDADLLDLARVFVSPSPEPPEGAKGRVTLASDLERENVRIWKKALDGSWSPLSADLTVEELKAGVELGIEGLDFRRSLAENAWDGYARLTLQILDAADQPLVTEAEPDGADDVVLRVAPWLQLHNLSKFDRVWANKFSGNAPVISGITKASNATNVEFTQITTWSDIWTQDYFQTGMTHMPSPDGGVHGMRVAMPRPWGRTGTAAGLPVNFLRKNYLGPDYGIVVTYAVPDSGDTTDSFGNHDGIPPYTKGDEAYPIGRILHGSGILKPTRDFYGAQLVQKPFKVDTSWLIVKHVDEFTSWVPAKTARGWKMLVASPALARSMLEQAELDGHGAVTMFTGKYWDAQTPATISVSATLADPDIMADSQFSQTKITTARDQLVDELGLGNDEVIELPILFEDLGGGKVAYQPGTVNLLALYNEMVIPDPFGPVIDGVDIFKKDMEDRLATEVNLLGSEGTGLAVTFSDNWNSYHVNLGEIHCGSNPGAPPSSDLRWWEMGQ